MRRYVVKEVRLALGKPAHQLYYVVPFSYDLRKRVSILCSHIARISYRNSDHSSRLFTAVGIQSQTGCNYSCPFCPQNKEGIKLPKGTMEMELYEKIIAELSGLDFSGLIRFGSTDEPLLDQRLVELVSIC